MIEKISLALQKGFVGIVAIVVLALASAGGYHFYKKNHDKKVEQASNELFVLQKELGQSAQKLMPEEPQANPLDPKKMPKAKPKPTAEQFKTAFSPTVEKLQTFIKANEGTQPAVEAALLVTEATSEYQKYEEGVTAIQNAVRGFSKNHFLYGIAQSELGSLYANLNKCSEATQAWDQVISSKNYDYMADQLRLKSGLCYQKLGMFDKAQKQYEKVLEKGSENSNGRMARKFLLYLKYEKSKAANETNKEEQNSEKS